MEIITFEAEISENSRQYSKFKNMRIVLNTKTNNSRIEVYNDNEIKQVLYITIKLNYPFSINYKFANLSLHKSKNRYIIVMCNDKTDIEKTYIYLAKYVYITNKNNIPKGYEIDHKDGNKLDDRIYNLCCITSEHNKEKHHYVFWLDKYNQDNNTNYHEQDLIDINILNKVKQYFNPIINDLRKENKLNYIEQYRKNNFNSISKQRKDYREKNLELMKNASKNWRENNRDYIKNQTKEYNDKNRNSINERNMLARRIESLLKKPWTKEIGITIKQYIERILELWNISLEDINKGLSTLKYKHHTIKNLNKLKLLHYEQETKLMD